MSDFTLHDLTPDFFLQTFIVEMMNATEHIGGGCTEQLVENIAVTAGHFFEELYRKRLTDQLSPLDLEHYTKLILAIKNQIGGQFSLLAVHHDGIALTNNCCPFGEKVTAFPGLCRMTSSVFGGIAARNFGYAKVEISKSIARGDPCCDVYVHLNAAAAENKQGLEYHGEPGKHPTDCLDVNELQYKIQQKMLQIWRRDRKPATRCALPVIVADSQAMKKVLQAIEYIAPTTATVLIQGATGVGKELVARAIHAMSDGASKPFIAVNCGAIADGLVESALFGHEKGAFTGAIEVHQGFFERAEGGTLFLDEVDSLSSAAQTRLLRVLQEGELERVGGKQVMQVNVRIIAATNVSLKRRVQEGAFRNDLYYRLNVVKLSIPSLAERPEDLAPLVRTILKKMNTRHNRDVQIVSPDVMQQIMHYPWPGNVRQLENTLERSVLFCRSRILTELLLDDEGPEERFSDWRSVKAEALATVEEKFLRRMLLEYDGDVKQVAESMGITPRAVYGKMKKYALKAGSFRST